jgi:hypothetical protein
LTPKVVGNENKQTNKKANDFFWVQKRYSWHQENINMFFLGNGKKDSKVFFLGCRRGILDVERTLAFFFKQWKNILKKNWV